MGDNYLTINEICGLLKVSRSTVNRWIRRGRLQSKKIGRLVRVTSRALAGFVEARPYHVRRKARKGSSK